MNKKHIKIWGMLLFILILLDVGTTYYGISQGIAREAHPFSAQLFEELWLFWGLLMVMIVQSLFVLGLTQIGMNTSKDWFKWAVFLVLWVGAMVRMFVVLNNFGVILG